MGKQQGRGGIGSHKHGISGRAGPPRVVKWATARFFNRERLRRTARKWKMYGSVREALDSEKPK